jgi:hypothetical protein
MNYFVGFGFLVAAGVVVLFGDRSVQEKGGVALKVFSWPKGRASLLKWPIAVALAGVGVSLLLRDTL